MPSFIEIDTQWRSAGNITDRLASRADCVGRCQDIGRSGYTDCVACPL
jgi:hypothetical protein